MVFVASLVNMQPFYTGYSTKEDAATASKSAYGCLGFFIFTFGSSLFGLYFHAKNERLTQGNNGNFRPMVPAGMSTYQVELTGSSTSSSEN